MRFTKPASTIDQQIGLLRERGMVVGDESLARRWLMTVGYYRLSAYWLPYEHPPAQKQNRSKQFRIGTTFEDVVDLYVFDRRLRLLVTEAIERIEIAVRARWTNRMVLAHGPHAHLDPKLHEPRWKHARRVAVAADRAGESRETFVEHYKKKYDDPYLPPLWMATELMTFGELSKWVEATDDVGLLSALAHDLGFPTRETMTGTLQLLSYVRNICAHHGRLWNRRTVKRLPNIRRFNVDLEPDTAGRSGQRQTANTIYNVLVVLVRLMRQQADDTTYPVRLRGLIETRNDEHRAVMGFPRDWRGRPVWS